MSEIKPKFAPKIQELWDSCGTHLSTLNPEEAAMELQFFVNELVRMLALSALQSMGYINE